jgi:nucleotide-binding universal stress UspA family protein
MYNRILLPLDNSPSDTTILNHIWPFAQLTGARLILVHVADGFAARLKDQLNLADSEEIKTDRQYLETCLKALVDRGIKATAHLVLGEPSDQILKLANQEKCDLIAMATHGHRLFKDLLLGSVADNIRHRTSIPILMIRARA